MSSESFLSLLAELESHQCGYGWLLFENTCFYLSTVRLNWSMSQKNCTDGKGDLAVISSQSVQVEQKSTHCPARFIPW